MQTKNNGDEKDRINRFLTEEDLLKLKDMHYLLADRGYDLTGDIEHLAGYLDSCCEGSMPIKGTDKTVVVKPEIRLETMLGDSGKELEISPDHPEYNPESVGPDAVKQRIDCAFYETRREFIREKWTASIRREDILKFELELRQKDIRDHRFYLYQETQSPGRNLYGRLSLYGDEKNGIFLTVAVGHWLKEQGDFFYDRAAEHYVDLGIHFEWRQNLERAVVVETVNGDIKHYPISSDRFVRNEGLPAQIPLGKQLEREGCPELFPEASIVYREAEERIRREGLKTPTGIVVLPSTIEPEDRREIEPAYRLQ